jgi:purine-binding chemotaxis protein CheW
MKAVSHADAVARWVGFTLDHRRFALPLESVSRVVRAAGITPLPQAPHAVAGALDVAGTVLPVYDLRRRMRLPDRPMRLDDLIIIARTPRREVALVVDRALGLIEALPVESAHVPDVLSTSDGLMFIQDLERFLSPAEDEALESALRIAEVGCKPTP